MENLIYKCPVCGEVLVKGEKSYICANNHTFDISEKRYINLLLANQKKTKDPGDNKQMMESRRDFLNKGFYAQFSEGLNRIISQQLNENAEYILDSGCGEGYFISKLKEKLSGEENRSQIKFYGMDISKSAIKYASKRDKSIHLAVGSSFNLPFLDGAFDCVIRNFAPGDPKEFYRVLKEDGKLVIVTPGIEHLFELKEVLYEKARKNEVKDSAVDGFKCIEHQEIRYSIQIDDSEDTKNLISMTPYYWSITSEMREKIDEIASLETSLHFNIDVYAKKYI